MNKKLLVLMIVGALFSDSARSISLDETVNHLALRTPRARILLLNYENSNLEFENYQKSFLPTISFSLSPLSFNNSLRLLQDPVTGAYTYVKDNANTSSGDISIHQRIGLTGGTVIASSSMSFLREFSNNRNSYSTSPLYLSYNQPLRGGARQYKLTRAIRHLTHKLSKKNYCAALSEQQQKILSLYMAAWQRQLQADMARRNVATGDTLLAMAALKLDNGYITKYDYNQIELKQIDTQLALESAVQEHADALLSLCTELGVDEMTVERPDAATLPEHLDQLAVLSLIHENNPQAMSAELKRRQAEQARLSARMETRFNGNISLNYGLNQYAPTFAEAYRRPDRRQAVSVTFTIPAFQWGVNRNKRLMADNTYNAAIMEIDQTEKVFENEVKTQIEGYNHTRKTHARTERSYNLAQEQYRLAVEKFGMGKISVYELFSAYDMQMSAMQQFFNSLHTLYSQYYRLRHLALHDFVSGRDLEDIYVPHSKKS